jgi:1,2-phenylacetyl-CoA epoxidase catalytic subunit
MVKHAQPKMDELRQQYIEKIRNEVERSTMEKLQQQLEAEAAGLYQSSHQFSSFRFL